MRSVPASSRILVGQVYQGLTLKGPTLSNKKRAPGCLGYIWKNTTLLLSVESWLFNKDDPYNGFLIVPIYLGSLSSPVYSNQLGIFSLLT